MFRFAAPLWLLALLALPALGWLRRRRPPPALALPSTAGLGALRPSFTARTRWFPTALKAGAAGLMIVGLARPQWGNREVTRLTEGINIVLAVDSSQSMAAVDFTLDGQPVERLDAVKAVVRDFVGRRDGDRIGLVVFGSAAYTQMPLTTDYHAVVAALEHLEIGAAGNATAVGDALGIAVKRLQDVASKSNVVILLTDGRSNTGELTPQVAADAAKTLGVKVYTIGIGSRGQVPFVVEDPVWGRRVVYRRVDIDEEALVDVASRTGGTYFHAEGLDGLRRVYEAIDRLEKNRVRMKTFEAYQELYGYAVISALALLLVAVLATNTRYLEAP